MTKKVIDCVSSRSPGAVDVHVGARVRLRRQILRMSQETLAKALGITFQQVQKYERGSNRVGASRLWKIAKTLDVPVNYFFEGLEDAPTGVALEADSPTATVYQFINSHDGVAFAKALSKIDNMKTRRRILELVRTLADEPDPEMVGQ